MILKLFRALMPQDDLFVPLFSQHAALGLQAAHQFVAVVTDPHDHRAYDELCRIEHEADEVAKRTLLGIHQVFVTPFDRVEIRRLSKGLDDVVDIMKDAAGRIRLYQVKATPEMVDMANCARRACEQLRDGIPLLSAIPKNQIALKAMCEAIDAIESEADQALKTGLQALFATDADAGSKLLVERVYQRVEDVVDECEDLSDVVQDVMIEQV